MKVALYARVSTHRQAQTQNIEQQLERSQGYAQDQGWSVTSEDLYRDDGYTRPLACSNSKFGMFILHRQKCRNMYVSRFSFSVNITQSFL